MNSITSGDITGEALKVLSDKYNILAKEIQGLKDELESIQAPSNYRILTQDYFKALCKKQSRLLAHSLRVEKRAFVEKCITAVKFS